MKLSLAIIARNEQGVIGRCLRTVRHLVDEIIVVDTGSTDDTVQEARDHGATVHHFKWIDDFGAARNYSFSKCTGDYIFWLDADDILLEEDQRKLAALRPTIGSHDAYLMKYNYTQDENGNSTCSLFRHRIVRRCPEIHWAYPIHECLRFFPGYTETQTDIVVTHKRSNDAVVKAIGRNHSILQKLVDEDRADQRMRFYHATELTRVGRHEDAIKYFDEYFKRGGDWHDNMVNGRLYMAYAYLALGRQEEAIETCTQGIKLDPRWAEFYSVIGQVYYDRGQWEQAARWFERAAQSNRPQAWGTVGDEHYTWVPQDRLCKCYYELGRIRESYEANERALKYRQDGRMLLNREILRDRLFPGRVMERPCRLNLGAGAKPVPGYRRVDVTQLPGIDEVFDQSSIPYRDSSIHALYSEHALEHCAGHAQAADILREWSRVLRPRGHLTLKVPDLEACCRGLADGRDRQACGLPAQEWYKYTIYGIQRSNHGEPDDAQHHHTGFTSDDLVGLAHGAGMRVTRLERYDGWGTPSLHLEAVQASKPLRVRWVVPSINEDYPSCRIRVMNIHRQLTAMGVDSQVLTHQSRDELRAADVVIIADVYDPDLMAWLARTGIPTLVDMCEDVVTSPECLAAATAVVCCSTVLAEKLSAYGRTVVLPDAVEPCAATEPPPKERPLVGWCGMGGGLAQLERLRPIIACLGLDLVTISEWQEADVNWDRITWLDELAKADIVIAPQQHWLQPAKSNTKVTQAMALGRPVIASPLQSYREAIKHGETGFICETGDDWETYLRKLGSDPELRRKIGRAAAEAAIPYSLQAVGERWLNLLEQVATEAANPPAVDIVIPTLNNLTYLKECIESIRTCTDRPYKIIVVNSGTQSSEWLDQQMDVVHVKLTERAHFATACNRGVAAGDSPYICLLNDDTIVSQGWLDAMVREAAKPGVGAVGPLSNCDIGWLHNEQIVVNNQRGEQVRLVPGMVMDQVRDAIPQIRAYTHAKQVVPREWVAFYATLIPRAAWDSVGPMDEEFLSGCEDTDYCKRLVAAGYTIRQTYDSFVFHFGAQTRRQAEESDRDGYVQEDVHNHRLLAQKYGTCEYMPPAVAAKLHQQAVQALPRPRKAAIYTGMGWERWSPRSVTEGGIGGSETMVVHAARELARRGWEVVVFNDCGEYAGEYDGVRYEHHDRCLAHLANAPLDLFISSRRADPTELFRAAKQMNPACKILCWVHDIFLSPDQNADINPGLIDHYLVLSGWHRDFFINHHGAGRPEIPYKLYVTTNVIDHSRFDANPPRDPNRFIYSSSPDRGLDVLLGLWPRIRKEVPDASLHVYYGFDNWVKALQHRGNPTQLKWMEQIKAGLNQPGVHYHGRVGQAELADAFLRSGIWAYPTYFTETFCITAVEAMAAGVPVVTSDLAGLHDTVGKAGILIGPKDAVNPYSPEYQEQFIQGCLTVLRDRAMRDWYVAAGLRKAAGYTPERMIEGWLMLCGLLDQPNKLSA